MLSATVPNPLTFADWVGRTKKKKMYVISTLQRPVPLQHYLYTGTDGKTRDDKFLVLDKSGQFLQDGYDKLSLIRNCTNALVVQTFFMRNTQTLFQLV